MLQGMNGLNAEILKGCWYVALAGSDLKRGRMTARTIAGEPILFARRHDGSVFAIRDACPHRGIPLRHGTFDGTEIACCYHGWKFNGEGICTTIPSLAADQPVDIGKIGCGACAVVERYGLVWVYIARNGEAGDPAAIPHLKGFSHDEKPRLAVKLPFECNIDHAAIGLMDPTHVAYIHAVWWFRKDPTRLRDKEKRFEPAHLGWKMVRHELPAHNIAYRLFGEHVFTEIAYELPGYRIEHIEGTSHRVAGLTALTPIDASHTEVHQFFWSTAGWLSWFRPLIQHLMTVFLDQDRRAVILQREGLEMGAKTMLINDADTQARWWARIKDEWLEAGAEGRPFRNPLEARTLRWRS